MDDNDNEDVPYPWYQSRNVMIGIFTLVVAVFSAHDLWALGKTDGAPQIPAGYSKIEEELKLYYQTKIKHIPLIFWNLNYTSDSFDPVWSRMVIVKETVTSNHPQKFPLHGFSDIFKKYPDSSVPHKILIAGESGVGKSTLINQMAVEWAESGRHYFKTTLMSFKAVFVIRFVAIQPGLSLGGIIKDQLFINNDYIYEDDINAFLQAHEKEILLLFDGLESYHQKSAIVNKVIDGQWLSNSIVVITTNSMKSYPLNADRYIKMNGLDETAQNIYIKQFFSKDQASTSAALLENLVSSHPLRDFARIPIWNAAMCSIFDKDNSLPKSSTTFFHVFLEFIYGKIDKTNTVVPMENIMHGIGHLALKSLLSEPAEFEIHYINDIHNVALKMGLLKLTETQSVISKSSPLFGSFLQKAIQEYLATWYIMYNDDIVFKAYLSNIAYISDLKSMLKFALNMKADETSLLNETIIVSRTRKLIHSINDLAARKSFSSNSSVGDLLWFSDKSEQNSLFSEAWKLVMNGYHDLGFPAPMRRWTAQVFYYIAGKRGTLKVLKNQAALVASAADPTNIVPETIAEPYVVHLKAAHGTKIGLNSKQEDRNIIEMSDPKYPGISHKIDISKLKIMQLSGTRLTRGAFTSLLQSNMQVLCLSETSIPKGSGAAISPKLKYVILERNSFSVMASQILATVITQSKHLEYIFVEETDFPDSYEIWKEAPVPKRLSHAVILSEVNMGLMKWVWRSPNLKEALFFSERMSKLSDISWPSTLETLRVWGIVSTSLLCKMLPRMKSVKNLTTLDLGQLKTVKDRNNLNGPLITCSETTPFPSSLQHVRIELGWMTAHDLIALRENLCNVGSPGNLKTLEVRLKPDLWMSNAAPMQQYHQGVHDFLWTCVHISTLRVEVELMGADPEELLNSLLKDIRLYSTFFPVQKLRAPNDLADWYQFPIPNSTYTQRN